MKVKVIASGSKGNSTLIRTDKIKLLIPLYIKNASNGKAKITFKPS